jgi:hypothetical protein
VTKEPNGLGDVKDKFIEEVYLELMRIDSGCLLRGLPGESGAGAAGAIFADRHVARIYFKLFHCLSRRRSGP